MHQIFDKLQAGLPMTELSALLKEIEDVKIDGTGPDNLNESLRALVTHDQKITTIIEKGKATGMKHDVLYSYGALVLFNASIQFTCIISALIFTDFVLWIDIYVEGGHAIFTLCVSGNCSIITKINIWCRASYECYTGGFRESKGVDSKENIENCKYNQRSEWEPACRYQRFRKEKGL